MGGLFNRIIAGGDMLAATYDPASKSEQLLGESDIVTTVGDPGSDTEVPSEQATREALNAIDQKKLKSTYFATIASGTTSGTITKPAGAGADVDFIMDEWGTATDALVSTIENGKPTFKSPVNAAGNTITTTLDTSGNYAFSDTPSPAASHALIYVYTCYIKNFSVAEALWETELLDYLPTHAASHIDGTDDIQSATNAQKGLATAAQITTLESRAASGANNDITSLGALSGAQTIPTIDLTGGQIAFPATAVPSADANTLDDYEKGDYTVTITLVTSGSVTLKTTYNEGTYTKRGREVAVQAYVAIDSISSPVGSARINLPFTSADLSKGKGWSVGNVMFSGVDLSASLYFVVYCGPNVAYLQIKGIRDNAEFNTEAGSIFSADDLMMFTITYIAI